MKKIYKIKIGNKIKEIRKEKGYTQKKLALAIGVTPRYICDIETNRTQASYDILIKICKVFQITPNELFEEYIVIKNKKKDLYSIDGAIEYLKNTKRTLSNKLS